MPSWGGGAPEIAITLKSDWDQKITKGPDFDVHYLTHRDYSITLYVGHHPQPIAQTDATRIKIKIGKHPVTFFVTRKDNNSHADAIIDGFFTGFQGSGVSALRVHIMIRTRNPDHLAGIFKYIETLRPLAKTNKTGSETLPKTTKERYTLTITKGKVVKEKKQNFCIIPATLTNKTKNTLRYFSMSCSWQDFYMSDNDNVQIEGARCDKNIPIIITLAPGQARTVEVRLLIRQTIYAYIISFKIAFNLVKVSNNQKSVDFYIKEKQKKKNVIWSNIISM